MQHWSRCKKLSREIQCLKLIDTEKGEASFTSNLSIPLPRNAFSVILGDADLSTSANMKSNLGLNHLNVELEMPRRNENLSMVMEKAKNDVRGILGERRVVLESDLPHLHYMKAVSKEIFRFHPPVPVLVPRESIEDVTIDGYKIPAKTRVIVNAWAIGREKESWEDPETFKSEIFLGSEIDYRGQDFELIPGRRGCPAITFATAVVELALAQPLHSFDWELPLGITAKDLDLTEVFGISMHRRDHLHVVAKPHFP